MYLKHVGQSDIDVAVDRLIDQGLPDEEIVPILKDYLPELNYQRSKNEGPPLAVKSMLSSAGRHVSDKLLGATAFTPGRMFGVDTVLEKASAFTEDKLVNPNWERQTEEAAGGSMNILTEEGRTTWTAIISGQVPIMADMILSSQIGKTAGGLLGGLAGPKGAVLGGKVGEIAAPLLSMSLSEAGSFLRSAEAAGVDSDLAQGFAGVVGVTSGGVEQLQQLSRLGPFLKTKKASANSVRKRVAEGIVSKNLTLKTFLVKEFGENVAEGIEEMIQGGIQHVGLSMAIKAMKKRHGEDWEPLYFADPDFVRDGLMGFGSSVVLRAGTRAAATPYAMRKAWRDSQTEKAQTGKDIYQGMKDKNPDVLKSDVQSLSVGELGQQDARNIVDEKGTERALPQSLGSDSETKKVNPERAEALVKSLQHPGLVSLLTRQGITTDASGKNIKDMETGELRDLALANFHLLKEGFQLVPTKDKKGFTVVFTPIVSDVVPEGERVYHRRLNNQAVRKTTDKQGVSYYIGTLASIWEKDAKARVQRKALQTEIINAARSSKASVRQLEQGESSLKDRLIELSKKIKQVKSKSDNAALRVEFAAVENELVNTQELISKTKKDIRTQIASLKGEINRTPVLLPYDSLPFAFWEMKNEALKAAGLSDAIIAELNPLEKSDNLGVNEDIDNKLTNTQHVRYTNNLEGQLRDLTKQHLGKESLGLLDANLWGEYMPPSLLDVHGKPIQVDPVEMHPPRFSTIWRKFSPFLGRYQAWAKRTGLRFMDLYSVLHMKRHDYQVNISKVAAAWASVMAVVPSGWVRGKGRGLYMDGVSYLLMSNDERKAISDQLKISHIKNTDNADGNIKAIAEHLKNIMGLDVSVDEIIKSMKDTAEAGRVMLDYPIQSGMLPFEIWRKDYVPLMREWANQKDKQTTFTEFLRDRYKTKEAKRTLHDNMDVAETYIQKMSHLGDTIRAMEERHGTPGKATPFMEYQRNADLNFGKELGAIRNTNFEELLDAYYRQALRRDHFADFAPTVFAFLNTMDEKLGDNLDAKKAFRLDIADFMDAILDVPSDTTTIWRGTNLRSSRFMITRMIDSMMTAWNNNKTGRIVEMPDTISPQDVQNSVVLGLYALYLGVSPLNMNFTSPVKNLITQNVMAMSLGVKYYFEALRLIATAATTNDIEARELMEEIKALNLRMDRVPLPNSAELFGHGGIFKQAAEHMLYLFKSSDEFNVKVAAATAMVGWNKFRKDILSKDPTGKNITQSVMDNYLFEGKGGKGIDPNVVMAEENSIPIPFKDQYKSTAPENMKSISLEVWDRIRKGNSEEAKRLYIQYAVNLSQWHYGAGGTPTILRNPVAKLLGMFSTWPANYIQWNTFMASSGLMKRWVSVMLAQWLLACIFSLFGYSAYKWIMFGALPDELAPMGPAAQFMQDTYSVLKTSGIAAQANMAPIPKKDKEKAVRSAEKSLETMLDNAPVLGHVRKKTKK
jgi:hypothetical protein